MALPRIQESQVVENEVSLTGVLCEEPQLDYTTEGAAYLETVIEVKRPSATGSDRSASDCADEAARVRQRRGRATL